MAKRKHNPAVSIGVSGIGLGGLGALASLAPAPFSTGSGTVIEAGLILTASAAALAYGRRGSAAVMIDKMDARSRQGVATTLDRARARRRLRRKARVLRPSLYPDVRPWDRVSLADLGFRTVRVGGRWLWSSCEDVSIRFGGPRQGKTAELACQVIDAPGAVLVTSTSTDIVTWTAPSRSAGGRTWHLFNPEGLAGWASTIKWSPLIGCRDASTAQLRAADMIPQSGDERGERWDGLARDMLAVLLHAAALGRLDMHAVLGWVADPDPKTSGAQVEALLRKSSEWQAMTRSARQLFGLAAGPKTSVTMTMRPALEWVRNPRASRIGDAQESEAFDVAGMIERGETLYLLGQDSGMVAPLIAALTADIVRQARRIAGTRPGGRLDPCLTIALDEAYRICRVPLPQWTSDMGKNNIALHISVQSPAQLVDGWGPTAARVILDNCATVIVYGGLKDPETLDTLSRLMGSQEVLVETRDKDGHVSSTSTRVEPIFTPDRISDLLEGWAIARHRGMPAVVGRAQSVFRRRDVRQAMRRVAFSPIEETAFAEQLDDEGAFG